MSFKIDISSKINALKSIKRQMGIPDQIMGTLEGISSYEAKVLLEKGVELNIEQINVDLTVDPDTQTLLYKGRRVILYIRDVATGLGYEPSLPKFHIAMCQTLDNMFRNNRKNRYVISEREDGIFHIIKYNQEYEEHLNVCKNCLDLLNYQGYNHCKSKAERDEFVADFNIIEFFIQYPKSPHAITGQYPSAYTAKYNQYPINWQKMSKQLRQENGYICQECGINLNSNHLRKYCHVHHIDGHKANNQRSNLKILCYYCHAQQPYHQHMQATPSYKDFSNLRKTLIR